MKRHRRYHKAACGCAADRLLMRDMGPDMNESKGFGFASVAVAEAERMRNIDGQVFAGRKWKVTLSGQVASSWAGCLSNGIALAGLEEAVGNIADITETTKPGTVARIVELRIAVRH